MWTVSIRNTFLHCEGDEGEDADASLDAVPPVQPPVLRSVSAPGACIAGGNAPSCELGAAAAGAHEFVPPPKPPEAPRSGEGGDKHCAGGVCEDPREETFAPSPPPVGFALGAEGAAVAEGAKGAGGIGSVAQAGAEGCSGAEPSGAGQSSTEAGSDQQHLAHNVLEGPRGEFVLLPPEHSITTQFSSAASSSGARQGPRARNTNTTLMLRNLPNNYTRVCLLSLLNAKGFKGGYDFVYLPIDFRTHAALGYAFVIFVSQETAEQVWQSLAGFSTWSLPSSKVCQVSWSKTQGLIAHIERYRNSPLMHDNVPDEYRPMLFKEGKRVPFPRPTKRIKPPRQGTERMLV